jgi:hypothetical protein
VAAFTSEWWPPSRRNGWPDSLGIPKECSLDDLEGDAAVEQSGCEAAVGASGEAGRAGCTSVEIDHLLGVALAWGHGLRLWRARP